MPLFPLRPITLQGSYVGSLEDTREVVALMKRASLKPIPVTRRRLAEVGQAMSDLRAGRVIGRTVLMP